jgi:sugar lactone lactonase YvrE
MLPSGYALNIIQFSFGTAAPRALTSLLVGSAAGSSSVVLTYPGAWTATANDSFLHISAGSASGTGNALVLFTYDEFTGTGTRTGTLTIAGLTVTVTQAGTNYIGPGPVITLVSSGLFQPHGTAADGSGNVYIADTLNSAIKEWSASTQQVTTLVPSGLNNPLGVAVDGSGNVYIADTGSTAIKEWSASTQQVTTLSAVPYPAGVAVDSSGNVFIVNTLNDTISEWSALMQQLTTLLSTGLSSPYGIAVDGSGNLYITNTANNAIKEWSASTQQVITLLSTGQANPFGVAVDGSGNVYFTDADNNLVREWSASTQQETSLVFTGLNSPIGVSVDTSGNVYIADTGNNAIKEIPNAFVGPPSLTEPPGAGSDSLLPVLPSTANLTGIFAPTSDQSWLTIGTIANGVISFSFTANPSTARTAHIAVLGQTITVTQNGVSAQTITFGALSDEQFGSAPFTVSATASSGLPVSFNSQTGTICTVSGSTVTLEMGGTCTIQATQMGNADYFAAAPVNQSFTVTPEGQTIMFGALSNQPYGTAPFTVSATASSGLPVSFSSQTGTICTATGSTVTLLMGGGICTIQASQLGNADYSAATPVSQSFTVTFPVQTITFGALSNQVYGTSPFTVSATASSGLPVSFSSQTGTICTVSGSTVTLIMGGTCTIQATQGGNAIYPPATPVSQSFTVTPEGQTIAFGSLSNEAFGTAPFAVGAIASSGLAVSFSSITPQVCTVAGATVTLVAVGTCTIQATQPGNADYSAATPASRSFTVTPGNQTITFGALSNEAFGTAPFTLSATAAPGLPVSFASTTTAFCVVSGTTVTLIEVGTCTIQATQTGNSNWNAATPVSQSFQVTQGSQTITFGTLSNQPLSTFSGTSPFTVNAAASSGLPVSFSSTTPLVCTLSGTTVTLVSFGTCSIQATQAGNNNWLAATPVTQSFHVIKSPCDVTQDLSPGIADVQAIISEALGMTAATDDQNKDGVVNAADIQIVINAVLGLGCAAS